MSGRGHHRPGHGHGHHRPGHGHGHHGHGHGQPPQRHEQTFKIFCRAYEGYCLTVRHDFVVLAPADPRDEYQHWVKDMRRSTSIRDEEGHGAFALVNKATGKAITHSHGQSHRVRLVAYNPDNHDESVLWTSKDVRDNLDGNGFRRIRMVNNIYLNFHVDQRRNIVLSNRSTGKFEQHWKIMRWCKHELAPKLCSLITSSLPLAFLMQRA